MSHTRAVYYPGPPDAAIAAFDADLQRGGPRPTALTWTGLHLVVLWEEDDPWSVSRLVAPAPIAAGVAAAILGLAGYLLIAITNDLSQVDDFYNALGTVCFGLTALAAAVGLRR